MYIDPQECIDCEACIEACPVEAIFEADRLPEPWEHYERVNADYFTP
jgi:NAD-dependent dihydropyrimidine dehydrogenase PreA subunit